jgi:hypothetical protein
MALAEAPVDGNLVAADEIALTPCWASDAQWLQRFPEPPLLVVPAAQSHGVEGPVALWEGAQPLTAACCEHVFDSTLSGSTSASPNRSLWVRKSRCTSCSERSRTRTRFSGTRWLRGRHDRPRELPLGSDLRGHSGTFTGGLRSCSSQDYWTVQAGWQDTGEGSRDPLGSPSPTAGTRRAVAARREAGCRRWK